METRIQFCDNPETREVKAKSYKVRKQRARVKKGFEKMTVIRNQRERYCDQQGKYQRQMGRIFQLIIEWGEWARSLTQLASTEGPVLDMQEEVKKSIKMMKAEKEAGCSRLTIYITEVPDKLEY